MESAELVTVRVVVVVLFLRQQGVQSVEVEDTRHLPQERCFPKREAHVVQIFRQSHTCLTCMCARGVYVCGVCVYLLV